MHLYLKIVERLKARSLERVKLGVGDGRENFDYHPYTSAVIIM